MRPWLKTTFVKHLLRLLQETRGAELIEFAVSLPLMMVFTIGIYDFSNAFILKQKITQIASNAARVAANQPTTDLSSTGSCGAPTSICSIRTIVDRALTNNGIVDCGLSGTSASSPSTLVWTFSASGCTGNQLTLIINRGYTYDTTLPDPPFQGTYRIEATQVTLSYPYQWQFNKVITLIAPSANFGNNPVQSVTTMQNLN